MTASACAKNHSILENTRSQQVTFWNNDGNTASVPMNNNTPYIEISVKCIVYTQYVTASALLKNTVSIEEWLAATTFMKKRNTVLRKKLFPSIKRRKKCFVTNNYFGSQPFLMSCYLTKIFVHLSVISAFVNWQGGTQQTSTCSKSAAESLEKGVKYVQS